MKDFISQIISKALIEHDLEGLSYDINYPTNVEFGDYACNVAMIGAKKMKLKPMDLAAKLVLSITKQTEAANMFLKVEAIAPGFINFYIKPDFLIKQVADIIDLGDKYGSLETGKGKKYQIEFVSANPTGPLTLANGRGGFLGDVLANVLVRAGYQVDREYYLNDTGNQIVTLGKSLLAAAEIIKDEEDFYHGDYIQKWADENRQIVVAHPDKAEELGKLAAKDLFTNHIKPIIEDGMKIKFDNWFSEDSLHQKNKVEEAIAALKNRGVTYEQDGALWLRSTNFGDDKDRVLKTADDRFTYIAADIAYHLDKLQRGYDQLIDIWGADHGGYVARMQAAMEALGHGGKLKIIIMQLVKLMKDNQEVRMSKRKGTYITMKSLLEQLPLDVVRWFFLMYSNNTHVTIDLNLATDTSEKNPVYYVQYAHARLNNIITQAKDLSKTSNDNLVAEEYSIVKKFIQWPELINELSVSHEIHKISTYAMALADSLHSYYQKYRVIDNGSVNTNRLRVIEAGLIVLKSVLTTMGISAPDKM